MGAVPDQVLQWLYSVLLNEYHDSQRTYSDCVAILSTYSTLAPRTEVYTYNNGQPALLLCLGGTIPINFRGTTYRFPIKIWVPHSYPADAEGIMVFVVPGEGMVIRPGQHVSLDGRVYHPYLRDWSVNQRATIVDFVRILQDVFAREPPVVAKPPSQQQQQQQQQQQPQLYTSQPHSPMQRPPPPPKEQAHAAHAGNQPPPRPPKPGEHGHAATPVQTQRDGPPLPPLPHERPPPPQSPHVGTTGASHRYAAAPPLPHEVRQDYRQSPAPSFASGSRIETPTQRYTQPPPIPMPQQQQQQQQQQKQPHPIPQHHPQPMPYRPAQPQYPQHPQTPQQYPQHMAAQGYPPHNIRAPQPVQPKPSPAPDLLSDPFEITLPAATAGPAPPIPPNPEKEHLLHLLSQSLVSQIHQQVNQNTSALAPLQAQSSALQEAHSRLSSEISQLTALDQTLANNEHILRRAIQDCEAVIQDSKSTPAPPIDDVLVAPTVAATQLWNLQADEAAIREALWCLQRAIGAGRVSSDVFIRMTRALARELFLKMALSRKLAKGMGLDIGRAARVIGQEDGYGY